MRKTHSQPGKVLGAMIWALVIALAGVSTAALAQAERLTITNANGIYLLAVPVSNLTLAIPDSGLAVESANIAGSTSNPRYFNLSDKRRGLIISGWFEPSSRYRGAKTVWQTDSAVWKANGLPEAADVAFEKIGEWDAILYDMPLDKITQSHIRAHYIQDGTWIDTHLSLTNTETRDDNRAALRSLLKSFVVKSKMDTFAVGQHGSAR